MIDAEEAFDAHGRGRHALAVLRAAARPEPALRLRAGARDQAQAADALELGSLPRRLREHRGLRGRATPTWRQAPLGASCGRSTAGSSRGRRRSSRRRRRRYEDQLTYRLIRALRGVRRRPLQLVHPPLAPALLGRGRGGVPDALVRAGAGPPRRRAGDAVPGRPPLAEPRRRARARARRRASSSPAGRRRGAADERAPRRDRRGACESSSSAAARATWPGSSCASRSGGSSSTARRARSAHADEIAEELRVKEVEFEPVAGAELSVKPNLPLLGPQARRGAAAVRAALAAGRVRGARRRPLPGRRVTCSSPTRCFVERAAREGWALAEDGRSRSRSTSALDRSSSWRAASTTSIHAVNTMRKEPGSRSPTASC